MKKSAAILICILMGIQVIFAWTLVSAQAVESTTLSVTSSRQAVNTGDTFIVTVRGTNIRDMFAYELVLRFPQDKMELVGQPKTLVAGTSFTKLRDGSVQFGSTRQDNGVTAGTVLDICSFTFKAKAGGNASVQVDSFTMLNRSLESTQLPAGASMNIQIAGGVSVPEPDPINVTPTLQSNGEATVRLNEDEISQGFSLFDMVVLHVKPAKGATSYVIDLPFDTITSNEPDRVLSVQSEFATVNLPLNWMSNRTFPLGTTLALSITKTSSAGLGKAEMAMIGNRPIIGLDLLVNGKKAEWKNPDAAVTVSIPYKPAAEELAASEHIVIRYLDAGGNSMPVPTGKFDADTGMVSFTLHHFSRNAVAFVKMTFPDIQKVAWAKKPVEVLASKGIIHGVTATAFSPNAPITRADFLLLLVNTLGLSAEVKANFNDVTPADYYAEAVGIAKALGITKGSGNNRFSPKTYISRQDMMALAYQAMKLAGKDLDASGPPDLSGFKDKAQIASYSSEAVASLTKNGIVLGNGNDIRPKALTTRAEAAVILYRIYNK